MAVQSVNRECRAEQCVVQDFVEGDLLRRVAFSALLFAQQFRARVVPLCHHALH